MTISYDKFNELKETHPTLFSHYKYVDDAISDLANSRIPHIFWEIKNYNEELLSDDLPDICTYKRLSETLENPKDHLNDLIQVIALLQIKDLNFIEKDRIRTLEMVRIICEEELKDIPEAQFVLPPSKKKKEIEKVQNFYEKYDPFDFKHERLGYGQVSEDQFNSDGTLNYTKVGIVQILRDLHGIVNKADTPQNIKNEANELIQSLRNYSIDPVPDEVSVCYMEPGKDYEWVTIKNAVGGFGGLETLVGEDLIFKDLGEGVVAISRKDAKLKQLPKNRTIFTVDGRRLGIVRGPLVFMRMDEKGNTLTIRGNKEVDKWLRHNYARTEHFNETPLDNERAQRLLGNLFLTLSHDQYGYNAIRAAGFTEQEIKDYEEYLRNIGKTR